MIAKAPERETRKGVMDAAFALEEMKAETR